MLTLLIKSARPVRQISSKFFLPGEREIVVISADGDLDQKFVFAPAIFRSKFFYQKKDGLYKTRLKLPSQPGLFLMRTEIVYNDNSEKKILI